MTTLDPCHDFRITRRAGCTRMLNWAWQSRFMHVPDRVAFTQSLVREGWTPSPCVPGVFQGEDGEGNVLLVVIANLRVEIRVHYACMVSMRPKRAVELARRVAKSWREASSG